MFVQVAVPLKRSTNATISLRILLSWRVVKSKATTQETNVARLKIYRVMTCCVRLLNSSWRCCIRLHAYSLEFDSFVCRSFVLTIEMRNGVPQNTLYNEQQNYKETGWKTWYCLRSEMIMEWYKRENWQSAPFQCSGVLAIRHQKWQREATLENFLSLDWF